MLSSGRGTTAEIPVHNDDTANKQNTVVSISCIVVQSEGKSRCKLLQNRSNKEHKHVSKETINLDPAQVPRPNKIWRSRSNRRFILDWAETLIVALPQALTDPNYFAFLFVQTNSIQIKTAYLDV